MQPFARPSTPINRAQSTALYESPAVEKESHFGSENALRQAREASDNAVKEFEDNRTKIDSALEGLQYLVGNLKNGNRQDWPVRYPCLSAPAEASRHAGPSTRPGIMRRTMTYADDPNPIPVDLTVTPTSRQSFRRSLTMVQSEQNNDATVSAFPPPDACLNSEPLPEEDFSIMRLDLNLGATRQAKTLINRLEKASIASLLDNRFSAAMDHLGLLRQRIHDAHSRVLVTGDLNAGKSTLVNALLRRNEIMPTDEQPLTTRFVEVVNANENDGIEEIHVQDSKQKYDISDRASFSVEPIERLAEIISDAESDASSPSLTVYLKGNTTTTNPSILHNGVVEISLIDAPGLNRDSIKTTANFARQEEIDVVVFVVSAANHFTLSAKEFIWQAGHEKAHLFIVVNRFDQIRDKDRCRRLVLEQIKQLSPDTYKDAADLVHFVDSAKVAFGLGDDDEGSDIDETFSHLEHSLRYFVLVNRSKSKLGPARTYALRLLSDVELLASANSIVATRERDAAREEAARIKPVLDEMRKGKEGMELALGAEEDTAAALAMSKGKAAMESGLERVGRGLPATPDSVELPPYPGLLAVWDYAQETRRVLLSSLEKTIRLVEDEARAITSEAIARMTTVGNKYLPADVTPSKRQFRSEIMFTRRPSDNTSVVGLQLITQNQFNYTTPSDIIDFHHMFTFASGHFVTAAPSQELVPFGSEISSLGAASLALGAVSMLNGKSYGVKTMIDSTVRLAELASSPVAKKWAAPVLGALSLGIAAYIVYDLPQSIPRNVGRRLQEQMLISSGMPGDLADDSLPDAVAKYVGREVRKVTRLGAWGINDQHRAALDARSQAYKESQLVERKANDALNHFKAIDKSAQEIRGKVDSIKI